MTDQRIQYTEKMVGAGHPTLADTLNRITLVEHNNDGTHAYAYLLASTKGAANGVAGLDAGTLVPLALIPAALTGKDADSVDGYHAAGLAKAGANSDIHSIAGLTTPLSRAQGGSGYAQAVAPLFAFQHTAASITGTTSEMELFSCVIPGGMLGPNGLLKITHLWSNPNSANTKTFKVKLGGVEIFSRVNTTNPSMLVITYLRNRNSQTSQICLPLAAVTSGLFSDPYATLNETTIDTAIDQTLVITGKLANSSETMKLETVDVEVFR